MFVPFKPSQSSGYGRSMSARYFTQISSSLDRRYLTRQESSKHSSLFRTFVNYVRRKFYNTGPGLPSVVNLTDAFKVVRIVKNVAVVNTAAVAPRPCHAFPSAAAFPTPFLRRRPRPRPRRRRHQPSVVVSHVGAYDEGSATRR